LFSISSLLTANGKILLSDNEEGRVVFWVPTEKLFGTQFGWLFLFVSCSRVAVGFGERIHIFENEKHFRMLLVPLPSKHHSPPNTPTNMETTA